MTDSPSAVSGYAFLDVCGGMASFRGRAKGRCNLP